MGLRIVVGRDDIAASRFAISPLWELISVLRRLADVAGPAPADPTLEPVLARVRPRFAALTAALDLRPVLALQPAGWGADFLCPAPTGVATGVDDLLRAVRETPPAQARAEIAEALRRRPVTDPQVLAVLTGARATDRLADVLAAAWQALLAPDWPLLRVVLERDVTHRGTQLVTHGWSRALDDLDPKLRWREGGLELPRWSPDQEVTLAGRGLLLVPSVFARPNFSVTLDPPWPPSLTYPARGIAALWPDPQHAPSSAALERLLGSTRTAILSRLGEPATTSQLATELRRSLGGDAGLLTRTRVGRRVLYQRTTAADALLRTHAPPGPDRP